MDDGVGVAAGDAGVRRDIGVRQGLGRAVLTRVFVGDDDGLDALGFDLFAVHDQVGVGVAEAFLGDDGAVEA